jgi:hypothetical protein
MTRLNLLPCLLVSSLLLLTLQTTTISYIKSSSSTNMRSSFMIPPASAGSIVTAYINQNGAANSFNALLWTAWQTYPSGSPEQTATLTGSTNYTSSPLGISGAYRLEIVPSSTSGSPFPFSITIQVNNITIGSYSDVARYDRIFTYFHQSMGSYQVSASTLSSKDNSNLTLTVYGPFSTLQVSGGSQVATSIGSACSTSYSSSGNQYYYLVVHASDALLLKNQPITIKF